MNTIIALIIALTSYNVNLTTIGNKTYVVFEHVYDAPLDQDCQAHYQVTFNTPTGLQTVGYVFVVPYGTSGGTINPFRITSGWTVNSWEQISWGPYIPDGLARH